MQDDNGKAETSSILLMLQVGINRNEDVEDGRGKCQQGAVFDACPAHLGNSTNRVGT